MLFRSSIEIYYAGESAFADITLPSIGGFRSGDLFVVQIGSSNNAASAVAVTPKANITNILGTKYSVSVNVAIGVCPLGPGDITVDIGDQAYTQGWVVRNATVTGIVQGTSNLDVSNEITAVANGSAMFQVGSIKLSAVGTVPTSADSRFIDKRAFGTGIGPDHTLQGAVGIYDAGAQYTTGTVTFADNTERGSICLSPVTAS